MEKLQMKLSGETLALFDQYLQTLDKEILVNSNMRINKAFLLKQALGCIPLTRIDWKQVRDFKLNVMINTKGVQTTLILENDIITIIEQLRKQIISEFNTRRIYRPFIIKLIVKAALIKQLGKIDAISKNQSFSKPTIMQQNLNYYNKDMAPLSSIIREKQPTIIFFQEVNHANHLKLIESLHDYNLYYPIDYVENKDYQKMLCLLAVKKDCQFEQRRNEQVSPYLRYIEGKITSKDLTLELLLMHVPQAAYKSEQKIWSSANVQYYQDRVEYKADCLFAAHLFIEQYRDEHLFLGGDFNVDIRKDRKGRYKFNGRLQKMFEIIYHSLYDTASNEPTYKSKKFDYALVSSSISASKSELIETTSDHKMIISEIKSNLSLVSNEVIQ